MSDGLMTPREHRLVSLLCEVVEQFRDVIECAEYERVPEVERADLEEVKVLVHRLQDKVLAQAAARAYPQNYRLMGRMVQC